MRAEPDETRTDRDGGGSGSDSEQTGIKAKVMPIVSKVQSSRAVRSL